MSGYFELTYTQVGLAALLIFVNGAVSLGLRLGLTKTLVWAALRTIVQLLLIGLLLEWIFARQDPLVVLATAIFMTLVAGLTANSRLGRGYAGIWIDTCLSIWVSAWLVGMYALALVFRGIEPWYAPQHVIPLLGMILGNTLNGISLGLEVMLSAMSQDRLRIETRLGHGASGWEATRPERQAALKTGMMPIINAMMIVGLVSLPGMMTGQLLAGTSPVEAVKYQIAIMFLIASATALGTLSATVLCFFRLMNKDHQLQAAKIKGRGARG